MNFKVYFEILKDAITTLIDWIMTAIEYLKK
jgi:hypothetical protein